MSSHVDSAAFWSRKAEGYAKSKIKDMDAYERTLAATQALLSPEDRVLEVGCGTGTTALRLAGATGSYLGTDISEGMITIALRKEREAQSSAQFETCTLATAPHGPFDRVLAFNLLHLLPDLEASLTEIHARLVPGGVFVSKTVCRSDIGASLFFRFMMLALPVMQALGQAPFVKLRPAAELEAAIRRTGFEIETSENHNEGPPSRFIVARKV